MTETPDEALLRQAKAMAWSMGIRFYIRDGQIWQDGPGLEVEPPVGAHPEQAGRGPISEGAAG